jgi:multiple sugar transport system permease protein
VKRKRKKFIPYIILTGIAVAFMLPLLWVILASLDAQASGTVKFPANWTLGNYRTILENQANVRGFAVGLALSLVQSLLVVFISILAAYPLSRYELRFKKMFLFTILFMTALPITAVMVPVYRLFLTLGLYDTYASVILFLTASGIPYGVWLMKNFMDDVPIELEEAAWMDGCTPLQSIRTVIMPLMLPCIFVVGIFTFSHSWGNFFVPYILLQTMDRLPASVRLYQFFDSYGLVMYGQLAAYSSLYAMPSIFLYVLAQRYMSKGFSMAGAAKG